MDIEVKRQRIRIKPKESQALPVKSSFWEDKTVEQLAEEQGVKPIKTESDFSRIFGGLEDWDDVEEFLKEVKGI